MGEPAFVALVLLGEQGGSARQAVAVFGLLGEGASPLDARDAACVALHFLCQALRSMRGAVVQVAKARAQLVAMSCGSLAAWVRRAAVDAPLVAEATHGGTRRGGPDRAKRSWTAGSVGAVTRLGAGLTRALWASRAAWTRVALRGWRGER
jgi:hypothetical protein